MKSKITKAIFPVAGMGTRFLPATKASPKEMLPIVDKPIIQYAVEEAVAAGITDLIFVTGRNKRSIEDHFDKAYELENELQLKDKAHMLDMVRNIVPNHANCIYIRQAEALGLGHAISCAQSLIGEEAFAVILADELIDASPSALKQMVEIYQELNCPILGVQEIDIKDVSSYGIIKLMGNDSPTKYSQIQKIIEKPTQENAPSNLAVVGRYILPHTIFTILNDTKKGSGNEIQLSDAIDKLLLSQKIFAHKIKGLRYDCGSKLGYIKATIAYGLKHPEIGLALKEHLEKL